MRTAPAHRLAAIGFFLVAAFAPGLDAHQSKRLAFTSFGMEEGLSHGAVEAILQDEFGFIWIGTHNGLNRFDGTGFKAYHSRLDDPSSLGDDDVRSLALADSGRIWVGTQRGGLNLFDPASGRAQRYEMLRLGPWRPGPATEATPDRQRRTVKAIARLGPSTLILVTDVGLVRFESLNGTQELLEGGVGAQAACSWGPQHVLAGFGDGHIAWVTRDGILSESIVHVPDRVVSLRCQSDRTALVTTSGGEVYRLDSLGIEPTLVTTVVTQNGASGPIDAALLTDDDRLWLAMGDGVYVMDDLQGGPQRIISGAPDRSLPDPLTRRLFVDATGVLWIGTWNGLASLHPLSATMTRIYPAAAAERGLHGEGVMAINTGPDGAVWLGTGLAGVQVLPAGSSWTNGIEDRFPAFPQAEVRAVVSSPDGGLWVAAFGDGVLHAPAGGELEPVPVENVPTPYVYSVFVDRAGDVWAGTYSVGLLRYDPTSGTFRPFLTPEVRTREGITWVMSITEDESGRLWFGAFDGGLGSVGPDRAGLTNYYEMVEGGLSDDRILTLFVDSSGNVWIGTEGGGLNRLDPETETFTLYTVEDGLPHDNVEGVIEDEFGFLWVTTNDGLARFDRETEEFLVFREAAGLAGNRFYQNAIHRGPTGELYFGGPNGLTIVDPAAIEARGIPPRVALSNFRIQGIDAPLSRPLAPNGLDLAPDENFFTFEFAAMDFADPTQNRYRYKLDGLDEDWNDAGNTPVANYTSVPAASYVFRVQARNSEGVWNRDALAIPVLVRAPYYKRTWFRASLTLAVLSLITAFFMDRLHTLKKNQKVRLDIAGSLHDDIGADLSTIALKAEMIRSGADLDEPGRDQLKDVGRLARDMTHKLRETVWVVNTKYDTLAALVRKMRDTADDILGGHCSYEFEEPDSLPDRKITMTFRNEVHLLFKEALHNVVKHADATHVEIGLAFENRQLRLRVADDGVGFEPDTASHGNGQQLMRARAKACRGELRVTSQPGGGAVVELSARVT